MQKRVENKRRTLLFLFIALIVILLLLLLVFLKKNSDSLKDSHSKVVSAVKDTSKMRSGTSDSDTLSTVHDSLMEKSERGMQLDTVGKNRARKSQSQKLATDSNRSDPLLNKDSSEVIITADSSKHDTSLVTNRCAGDTIEPWVYPEPSGGLHYKRITVTFVPSKPCTISWRFETDSEWKLFDGNPISINKSCVLKFSAIDSCGNRMTERDEIYDIQLNAVSSACPEGMELAKVGTTSFCIDRYEWPNRKGQMPRAYVSYYQAMDSCYSVGKRLCTSDEWKIACAGPYSWEYPYGQNYEKNACITHDTAVRSSGSKTECRGYFGVYDMAGNLAEWTSTKSSQNRNFFNVMGGFWESGQQSSCFDARYSYFPQNRHNPVGFRCCKDAVTRLEEDKTQSRKKGAVSAK